MWVRQLVANRAAIFGAAAACMVLSTAVAIVVASRPAEQRLDKWGIREIYPTKVGGREWFMNPGNPRDGLTISPAATPVYDAGNGAWMISRQTDHPNDGVRMYVISPTGWKDVEITGYVKLDSFSFPEEFAWAARSGKHSPDNVCEATAYFGALGFSGNSWFQKKIFHGEGYTNKRYSSVKVEPLQDRWVGIKLVAYNVNSDKAVRLELWVDDHADNNWVKVAETIDEGGWSHKVPGMCARPTDYIISETRPRAMFRIDNSTFEFKNLSVREIDSSAA